MAKMPTWLVILLNFLLSDLFDQLIEWAKEIIESLMDRPELSKDEKRALAVALLRQKAAGEGRRVSRWQAGQAVELAFADVRPERIEPKAETPVV